MDRTLIRVVVLAGCSWYGGAALAAEPPASAPQPTQATSAAPLNFSGNPCQVVPGSPYEAAELSAFDEWQGAWTTPLGDHKALVFGVVVDPEPAPAADRAEAEEQAVTQAAARQVVESEQRRRFFALGLAVLLNLNANR